MRCFPWQPRRRRCLGGADSVFLLHALREIGPRWNLETQPMHVDHGIRGNASHDDAEFVRDLAAKFNLPFHILRANYRQRLQSGKKRPGMFAADSSAA